MFRFRGAAFGNVPDTCHLSRCALPIRPEGAVQLDPGQKHLFNEPFGMDGTTIMLQQQNGLQAARPFDGREGPAQSIAQLSLQVIAKISQRPRGRM